MQSLADQLISIIMRKSENLDQVAEVVAKNIGDAMDLNSKSGKTFSNQEYDNTYSEKYAKRVKGGQTSPVTMRNSDRHIEQRKTEKNKANKSAKVSFLNEEFGIIFRYHHEGTAKGNKIRSLFPKTAKAVPFEIREIALKRAGRMLSGK